MDNKHKVAFYIRCSTEEQGILANPEGTIKNQEQRLRYDLEMKNRAYPFGQLAGIFIEELSAKDTNRPALQRMLKAIEIGEINMVMVTEYSRLSRSLRDFAQMWEHLKSLKCSVISLRENWDTSTAAGEMMLYNMANLNQYERRMTSERVTLSRIDRAQRGLFNGGIIPFGYKKGEKPGHLAIDEAEAPIAQLLFKKFLEIGTLNQTALWMNSNGFTPPTKIMKGTGQTRLGHFTVGNVYKILLNKVYIGILEYKKLDKTYEAKAQWPAIVEEEDFYQIQKILKKNHRKKKTFQKNRYPYTLSGIVFCKKCGDVMCGRSAHGRNGKVGYYEHGWNAVKNASLVEKAFNCGMHNRVPARLLEPLVHKQIEGLFLDRSIAKSLIEEAQERHAKESETGIKEKSLKRELSSYSAQLEALTARLANLPINVPADEIFKAMQLMGEKREKAQKELEIILLDSELWLDAPVELKDYESFLKTVKTLWFDSKCTAEMKEKIVKMLISRIEVNTDGIKIEFKIESGHFRRELKNSRLFLKWFEPIPAREEIDSASLQVFETKNILNNFGSRTCFNGAQ